jgi:S1-C subfamily serine protease
MMVEAVKEIKKGMFPIFRQIINGQQIQLASIGSGFFVNRNGIFITTAHLFEGTTNQTQFVYYGLLPDSLQNPPVLIQEIARDEANDIYIGRVNLPNAGFLKFTRSEPEVGKTVCIAGYPLPQITINAQGGFELGGVRRYFQPSFILDTMQANVVNAQGLVRTHNGFLIRDFGLYGMSGGPVVDVNGSVIGMQASVTDPRESTNGTRTITVQNAVAIANARILQFLEQNGIEFTIQPDAT